MMFEKVCIIGCGLIGSSLAKAIKKQHLSETIVSSNRSDVVNKKVIELKIVDDAIEHGVETISLHCGGEPTLNKKFMDCVRYIKNRNIRTVVPTNHLPLLIESNEMLCFFIKYIAYKEI